METKYFLIIYTESGDEIHFLLMDMVHYEYVSSMIDPLAYRQNEWDDVCKFMEFCYKNSIKIDGNDFWIQTYCDEEWPFNNYRIERMLSIPEFGC